MGTVQDHQITQISINGLNIDYRIQQLVKRLAAEQDYGRLNTIKIAIAK